MMNNPYPAAASYPAVNGYSPTTSYPAVNAYPAMNGYPVMNGYTPSPNIYSQQSPPTNQPQTSFSSYY